MSEQEWLECPNPARMLTPGYAYPWNGRLETFSRRKLRLFAVACCRRIWTLLRDARSQRAVEIAEAVADGCASRLELDDARSQAAKVIGASEDNWLLEPPPSVDTAAEAALWYAANAAALVAMPKADPMFVAEQIALIAQNAIVWSVVLSEEEQRAEDAAVAANQGGLQPARLAAQEKATAAQAALLREIFANPFRPSPPLSPAILAWNNGTVPKLAQAIYDHRRFSDMPILADALEEAGCDSQDILDHCRQPGEHVRGCWALDVLLGKE